MIRSHNVHEKRQKQYRDRALSPEQKKALLDEYFRGYKKDAK